MTVDRHQRRAPTIPRQTVDLCVAAALAGLVFLVRWLILDFDNDYFMHVAWATEMLRGASPVRDFVEPGFILQTSLSYASFVLGGYQLMGDGLLACAFLAGATAASYLVCRALGIPRWLSCAAALVAAATCPRLYAYPKVFVYPVAAFAMVTFAQSKSKSLVTLAIATAIAFLFRHDHGVYIGVYMVLSLIALHRVARHTNPLWTTIARYGALCLLMVSPWVLWVLVSGHAYQYWHFLGLRSAGMANPSLPQTHFTFDSSNPVFTLERPDFARVSVRWAAGTLADVRHELESSFGLEPLEPSTEDRTARYLLTRNDADTLQSIVTNPAVEDTHNIDRSVFRAPVGTFSSLNLKLQQHVPLVRLRILRGYIRSANALPWLAWLFLWLPLAAVIVALGGARARESGNDLARTRSALVITIAILAAISYQTLMRGSPDSRLGDVANLHLVLLAWVSAQAWRVSGRSAVFMKPLVVIVLTLTLSSAVSYGRVIGRLADAGVDSPTNLMRHAGEVAARYSQTPLDIYAPPDEGGLPQLTRWLNACTPDTDRVAVIGFEPELYVIADRGFAGGLAFYDVGWHNSDSDQRLVIDRWSKQQVPIVLAMDSEWNAFTRDYPLIRTWLDDRYAPWGSTKVGDKKRVTIWLRQADATAAHSGALPCLHPQEPATQTAARRRRKIRLWF